MILKHLERTTVTIVLIGTLTAQRPWVKYEIQESIKRNNGFLGVYIHHLKNSLGQISNPGPKPAVPPNVQIPAYKWDGNLEKFRLLVQQLWNHNLRWKFHPKFEPLNTTPLYLVQSQFLLF